MHNGGAGRERARAILAYAYQYTQLEFSQHEFQHEVSQHEFQGWFSSWSGFGPHVAEALYHKAHATQRHLDSTAWSGALRRLAACHGRSCLKP